MTAPHAATLAEIGGVGILFIVFFIAVFIVTGILGARAARQRREALQALAQALGFSFDPDSQRGPPPGTNLFSVFNTGDSRRSSNTLTGRASTANGRTLDVRMGDYQYVTESGSGKNRSRTTHHLSYLLIGLPYAVAMRLAVRREGFLDRVAGAIGFEDIDFESDQFSRRYHVASDDRKVAYDLFDPRMIEWCLANEIPPLEFRGDLLLITERRTWKPEEFRAHLGWTTAFIERWPEHLVQRLTGNTSSQGSH